MRLSKRGLVTVTCWITLVAAPAGADAQSGGAIAGRVTAADSSAPLWDIPVHIVTQVSGTVNEVVTVVTNGVGVFTAAGLPAGTYFAYTAVPRTYSPHRDYIDEIYSGIQCAEPCGAKDFADATPIVVIDNETTDGHDFALERGGFISGIAIDGEDGFPVNLELLGTVWVYRGQVPVGVAHISYEQVDQFGMYGLPDGAYTVAVSVIGISQTAAVTIGGGEPAFVRAVLTRDRQFGRYLPRYDATRVALSTTFAWEPHADATSYEYCFDTIDNDTCDSAWLAAIGTSVAVNGLQPATTYYWHVRAVNPMRIPSIWQAPGRWWRFTTAAAGGTVSGRVIDLATSRPLWNVRVSIVTPNSAGTTTLVASDTTREDGSYSVAGLPAGTYHAYTTTDNHHRAFVNEIYDDVACVGPCNLNRFDTAAPITVSSGQIAGGRDFALVRGGFIAGAIFDAVSGARFDLRDFSQVYAYTAGADGSPRLAGGRVNFTTGRDYAAFGLPPGNYVVHTRLIIGHFNQIFDNIVCAEWLCTPEDALARGTPIEIGGTAGVPASFVLTPRAFFSKIAPPDTTTNLSAVTLTWQAHSLASRYEYCLDTSDNGICDTTWQSAVGTSVPLGSLSAGVQYHWQVRLVNTALNPPTQEANNQAWWSFTTAPSRPTSVDDTYTAVVNTPLTVAAPGVLGNDAGHGSLLFAVLVTSATHGVVQLADDGAFTYTPGTGFIGTDSFSYRATSIAGPGNIATVTIVVGDVAAVQPPTGLYAAFMAGNLVTLRWTAPAAGTVPTGYVIEGGLTAGQVLASVPVASTTPALTFAAPPGAFFVRVHALNGGERSTASNEIRVFVAVPEPPSPPTKLRATVNGSALQLAWQHTYAGGAPTAAVLDVSGPFAASLPLPAGESVSFNNVPAGTYTLRVRAANAAGMSEPSNAVTVTFPAACTGAPLTPANLIAYRIGQTLYATWEPAALGPAQSSFVISVTGSAAAAIPTTSRMVNGMVSPGTYTLTVAASNVCGTSAPSVAQTVTVP